MSFARFRRLLSVTFLSFLSGRTTRLTCALRLSLLADFALRSEGHSVLQNVERLLCLGTKKFVVSLRLLPPTWTLMIPYLLLWNRHV